MDARLVGLVSLVAGAVFLFALAGSFLSSFSKERHANLVFWSFVLLMFAAAVAIFLVNQATGWHYWAF